MGQVGGTRTTSEQDSNSQFLWIGTTMYLVTNSDSSGSAQILSSVDYGINFTSLTTIVGLSAEFDPAICVDSSGVIHIVGTLYNNVSSSTSLILYRYDTTVHSLHGPYTLTSGSMVGSDYDVEAFTDGTSLVVVSLLNATNYPGESVVALVVGTNGSITSSHVLENSSFRSGNTYGQIEVVTIDNTNFELYVGSHPKQISFRDWPVTVTLRNLTSGGWDTNAATLYTLAARYVSQKLSVIADGQKRYLAFGIYSQSRAGLVGNILLGYKASSAVAFSWQTLQGSDTISYDEPTLTVAPEGTTLAWIQKQFNHLTRGEGAPTGPLIINNLNFANWTLTPTTNFRHQVTADFLRGTMYKVPSGVYYAVVANEPLASETAGATNFYSGYDTAPIAHVIPNSLTINRNQAYYLSGVSSFSSTLDPLTFSWSTNDSELILTPDPVVGVCKVFLPMSAGPAARYITVTLSVTTGSFSPVTDTCAITVLEVPPPFIHTPGVLSVARNVLVTISPTITDNSGYPETFSWSQRSGTPMTPVGGTSSFSLSFVSSGAAIAGEDVVWTLVVNDGLNAPVSMDYTVSIAAYAYDAENPKYLSRSLRPGNIAARNTTNVYPSPTRSVVSTNMDSERCFTMSNGHTRRLYISTSSVLVYGSFTDTVGTHLVYRQILPQNSMDSIIDAVQTESDETWIMTTSGLLCRYVASNQQTVQDLPLSTLTISALSAFTDFTGMEVTCSYGGHRVFALYGEAGCLLVQINSITGAAESVFMINTNTGYLYGANEVKWVRLSDVESTHTGLVFLGATDAHGNTFETLINLAVRQVVGIWDASKLRNVDVYTGEFLFGSPDTYAGVPQPPAISTPSRYLTGVVLFWAQERSDLVTGYEIFMSTDNLSFSFNQAIGLGSIQNAQVLGLATGKTYYFRVVAVSVDGKSAPSNVTSISL